MKVVYIIGEPGIGKTTLMRELVKQFGEPAVPSDKPVPHITYPDNTIQLGRDRVDFGGTDALAMNIQPRAVEFLRSKPAALVLAEGDRLANGKFFTTVGSFADLLVVLLMDPFGLLGYQRREAREHALGKKQDKTWVLSRVSKVKGLRPFVGVTVGAGLPLSDQVRIVMREVKR